MLAWAEHEAARRGMRVGSGVAAQVEGAWPYAPVLEALADLSRRHPALLDGLDDELRKEIESGLSGRTVEWTARGGHQRLFVAAAELVRLAAGTGVVLVVDDADQADDASLRLLHYLARSTVSERVLLVLGHRTLSPELGQIRRSLLGRGTAVTLDLQPLPRDEVRALVRTIAADADDALVDTVYAASGGVPLFVVELARSAAAGRDLVAESLVPPAGSDEPGELAAAAILGSTFDTDEFIEVTGLASPTRTPPWTGPRSRTCCCGPPPAGSSAMRWSGTRCWPRSRRPNCEACTAGPRMPCRSWTGRRPGSVSTWSRPAIGPARCPG